MSAVSVNVNGFEAVALPHLDMVYSMAKRLCGNDAEAEDLVQEVFLRALNSFDGFDLRTFGAKPWLLKILHNVFYNSEQRRRRQPTVLEDVDFDGIARELEIPLIAADGKLAIPWDNVDDELKRAIDRLAPEYAVVLLLWGVEEMSYREIATACNCPMGTVMSRLYRARQLLMEQLVGYADRHKAAKQRATA